MTTPPKTDTAGKWTPGDYPREWFLVSRWMAEPQPTMMARETELCLFTMTGRRNKKSGNYETWYPTREDAQKAIDYRRSREVEAKSAKRVADAATALLEALEFMTNVARMTPDFSPMAIKQADAALSKARCEA